RVDFVGSLRRPVARGRALCPGGRLCGRPAGGEVRRRVGVAAISVRLHIRPEAIGTTGRGIRKEREKRLGAKVDLKTDALPVLLTPRLCEPPARADRRLEG